MIYELWALDTGNMIAGYDTEAAALAEVQAYVAAYGRDAVADWALARNGDSESDFQRIADGDTLVGYVLGTRADTA